MKKSIFASWTMWFSILQILLGGVGMMSGLMSGTESMALIMLGMTGIGLRVKTSQPVI